MNHQSRRQFLEFMGRTSALALLSTQLPGCSLLNSSSKKSALPFRPIDHTSVDQLVWADGFKYRILLSWKDILNSKGEMFGFNNDYINWVPVPGKPDEIILWVNHESVDPIMMWGDYDRSKKRVDEEMAAVGGSLVHLRKENSQWSVVERSPWNRRITAHTPIAFAGSVSIRGKKSAMGTLANCAGGKTPNNKILTCEENYDNFWGEVEYTERGLRKWSADSFDLGWHKYYSNPPEHYGWVVEVDPFTGQARKLTGLGRCAHECATTTVAPDGRWVCYTGDDRDSECLYKFVSSKPGTLEEGTLYVAQLEKGKWLPLDIHSHSGLAKRFKTQLDLLIQTRTASKIVGGTPLDRPEDIEIDPKTGNVLVALTNNKSRQNFHGSLLQIMEKNADPSSLEFEHSTFITGGDSVGFSCPDNLVFDKRGDLWVTTDISGSSMNKPPYATFGNNGLYYIPMSGPSAGEAFQVASAPVGAELTGPCFSPDGSSLFLSVQHPGEGSKSLDTLLSHWPEGGKALPKPSVVEVQIPFLA